MKQQEEEKLAQKLEEMDINEPRPMKTVKTTNMFAGMGGDDSESDDDHSEQNQGVEEQKPVEQGKTEQNDTSKETKGLEANKPKKKPKKKKRTKKLAEAKEEDTEDADFIIQEQSDHDQPESKARQPVLALNPKNFNYNKELDSFFKGTRLSDKHELGPDMNKRQRNLLKQQLKKNKPNKKYVLAHNEDVIQKLPDKLDLKLIRTSPTCRVFGFEPTPKIASLHETYETMRNTMDPNAIQEFLMVNPYYPEALYDMAEFFRLQGNYKDANYLMEKLMFFYEECFTYEFKIFNDSGEDCMLDPSYNAFTNLFFKAVFKFMVILAKKGCYKAALEYGKLLLKLNPLEDPMGALLMIDHFALSASRFGFLKEFTERFGEYYFNKQASLLLYPNYIFSYAMCLFKLKTKDAGAEIANGIAADIDKNLVADIFSYKWESHTGEPSFWLTLATLLYPQLLRAILNVTEMHKQNPSNSRFIYSQKKSWADLFQHELFNKQDSDLRYPFLNVATDADIEGLTKVFEIYPERNKLVWRYNTNNIWMKAVVGNLINCIDVDEEKFRGFRDSLVA